MLLPTDSGMIEIVRQGGAWAVLQDGRLVREGVGTAIYKTLPEAMTAATRIAAQREDVLRQVDGHAVDDGAVVAHPALLRRRRTSSSS